MAFRQVRFREPLNKRVLHLGRLYLHGFKFRYRWHGLEVKAAVGAAVLWAPKLGGQSVVETSLQTRVHLFGKLL